MLRKRNLERRGDSVNDLGQPLISPGQHLVVKAQEVGRVAYRGREGASDKLEVDRERWEGFVEEPCVGL